MTEHKTSRKTPADPTTDPEVPSAANPKGDSGGYSGQEYDSGSGPREADPTTMPDGKGASSR